MKQIVSQKHIKSNTVIEKSKKKDQSIVDLWNSEHKRINITEQFFFGNLEQLSFQKQLLTFF